MDVLFLQEHYRWNMKTIKKITRDKNDAMLLCKEHYQVMPQFSSSKLNQWALTGTPIFPKQIKSVCIKRKCPHFSSSKLNELCWCICVFLLFVCVCVHVCIHLWSIKWKFVHLHKIDIYILFHTYSVDFTCTKCYIYTVF